MIRDHNVQTPTTNSRNLHRCARFLFDPSADATLRTVGAHQMTGDALPDNAVITRVFYDVLTTFTSAADTATLALHAEAANDIVSAIAINNGANPWDAGLHITAVIETAATMVKLSADRVPVATVAVQALTAGKLVMYVEYFVSD